MAALIGLHSFINTSKATLTPHLRSSLTSVTTLASRPCWFGGMVRRVDAVIALRRKPGTRYDRYLQRKLEHVKAKLMIHHRAEMKPSMFSACSIP